jgi:chromosome segregation ATPase
MSGSERASASKTIGKSLVSVLTAGTYIVQAHPGAALVCCCLAMFAGQFWSLSSLYDFERERELWSAGEKDRTAQIRALGDQREKVLQEISVLNTQLGETAAEVSNGRIERDRLSRELAEVQKQLSLARISESNAIKSRYLAVQESEKALGLRAEAEKRTTELETARMQLEAEIESAREDNEPLLKNVTEAASQLQKIKGDIAYAQKQHSDVQLQADTVQAKLAELRDQLIKESASLETVITEKGKALREREEVLSEIAAGKQASKQMTKEDGMLRLDIAELQKSILNLTMQKSEVMAELETVESQKAAAKVQLDTRVEDLALLEDEVAKLTAEETRLKESIKDLADKLPPNDGAPPN